VIPSYDSFDWFSNLLPLLFVLVPIAAFVGRGPLRRAALVLAGLGLFAMVAPRLALFHLAFWVMVAALQPLVAASGERRSGPAVLWGALLATLLPMLAWKLWPIDVVIRLNLWGNHALGAVSDLAEAIDYSAPLVAAIGLSFSAFRAADLLIKSNLGLVDRLTPGRVLAYGLFPPLLVVGPIASYDETAHTLEHAVPVDRERALLGGIQTITGLFKVFVVAYLLSWSPTIFVEFASNPPWRIWVALAAFTMFFYVNFAGYSDLAIGTGRLLGADLRPNFDSPYTRADPASFWNSWHMSLTRFVRVNVFTPIVGRHPERQYAATMLSMMLIGLWHSITWASAVFGLYHGVSLVGHRALGRRRPPDHRWRYAKSVLVFVWFGLSLPLLQLDLRGAADFYLAIVGVHR
jgi:D-alanyl-lipoteichoic acid acyltransferase DltB (MBOAT superfamily)